MFVLLDEIWLCGDPSNIRILRSDIPTYTDYWSSGDDLRPVSATTTNCPCFVPTVIYGVRVGEREKDEDEQRKQIERHFSSHGGNYCDWTFRIHARARTYTPRPSSLWPPRCFIIARSRVALMMMILSTGIILLCSSESCSMGSMGSGPSPKCPNRQLLLAPFR